MEVSISSSSIKADFDKLSPVGKAIIVHKELIIERWEKALRAEIDNAAKLRKAIIVNTLPALLENLSEMISPKHPRKTASANSTMAHEHGGERARMTEYDQSELIKEFRILRKVIIEVLRDKKIPYDEVCTNLIHFYIDDCIQASSAAFTLVQVTLREHMLATLTHDMRTPLSAAIMELEMIIRMTEDEAVRKRAKRIQKNHRRIDSMIHDLLNVTLLRAGGRLNLKLIKCNATEIVQEIIEALNEEQAARIQVLSNSSIEGIWDRGHLKRAMENLINNAFKYSEPNSEITINISLQLERVIFSVHNIGNPIPKEEIESIFQIFRRAEAANKGKNHGWGLGLPLVRGVAESHGGSVSVDSLKDGGTTFILDIPQDATPYQDAPVSE